MDDLIDDFDEGLDGDLDENLEQPSEFEDHLETQDDLGDSDEEPSSEPDLVSELLKAKGIQDSSKIKIENEQGEIEEMNWTDLSIEEQLEILRHEDKAPETDLDKEEIELLNSIRNSKMSPKEYMEYMQKTGVDNYIKNSQNQEQHYKVDDISDDELFVLDIINKVGDENITDEELQQALDTAKTNMTVFNKQVQAIRNEYKTLEDNAKQQEELLAQQREQERFDQFAGTIENSIRNFTEFEGFELNMTDDDRNEVYEFITGFDKAGNSIFSKALNDPDLLVQMAWFALNGKEMISDITDYFTNEISNVRKTSYQKGLEDARKGKVKDGTVYRKPKTSKSSTIADLDEDFI